MNLVWKLLRQHISVPQFVGFFFANLVGMVIILLGVQVYQDVQEVYSGEDSFMKADYIIVNKPVGTLSSLAGKKSTFSVAEIEDFESQPFVEKLGCFTSTDFRVRASFEIQQFATFSTDMFFESVPDDFVDVKTEAWHYEEGQTELPIILPRNYLDLYNFGYAQSRSLPKLSEGVLGAMALGIEVQGVQGVQGVQEFKGRIVGFSNRLNTILVPQAFMDWANAMFAKKSGISGNSGVSRLIVQVNNPADEHIAQYLQDNGYETDTEKLNASKTAFLLKMIVGIVMAVGLVICVLALYILMLSVYLLVEKNSGKLENLLLLGYSPRRVAMPYQMLALGLNLLTLVLALVLALVVRSQYMKLLTDFFPDMDVPGVAVTLVLALVLAMVVSAINILAVRKKIQSIWQKKD